MISLDLPSHLRRAVISSVTDPERWAQRPALDLLGDHASSAPERQSGVSATGSVVPIGRRPGPSRRRVWAARIVALVADGIQLALLPVVVGGAVSPVADAIDIVTALTLTALLGFRWAFLPTFMAEIVPFVDLVPTWTLAVFIITRGKGGLDGCGSALRG